jgi:hypothetical protein
MRNAIEKLLLLAIVCGACAGCGQDHNTKEQLAKEQDRVQHGVLADDADDPNRWAPSPEAIAAAQKEASEPAIRPQSTPAATSYAMNPRAAEHGETMNVSESAQDPNDIALGDMQKLPPPAPPPAIRAGDEADQFGLPEWEQMARGELHVKRIRY